MSVERGIRFDLIARLCPNTTGAELRSVATEVRAFPSFTVSSPLIFIQAGMFAIRSRRKVATERDFLDAVEKVVRQGTKFSSTYVFLLKTPKATRSNHSDLDRCIKCTIRLPYNMFPNRLPIDKKTHAHTHTYVRGRKK